MTGMVGAVDSGNSLSKWASFLNGRLVEHGTWSDTLATESSSTAKIHRWKLAGVHPERMASVKNALESQGKTCEVISDPASVGLSIDLKYPEKVGIDRVAAAWAAWLRTEKGSACVVVDAGTAVTIDYVDQIGTFRGGAILPGLDLMLKSLSEGTRLLPRLLPGDVSAQAVWPGRCTREAIATGTLAAQTGAVLALINMAKNKNPEIRVFVTGGGGGFLASALRIPVEIVGPLVLEGIAKAGESKP